MLLDVLTCQVRDEWFYFMSATSPASTYTTAQLNAEGPDYALITSPKGMTSVRLPTPEGS